MKVVLISPYEIGRQPFGLAQPAAWLRRAGCEVHCLDLSQQRLDPEALEGTDLVGLYLAMHTATRIAIEALPRIRELAPRAALCAYGLYAPMNDQILREMGVKTILGGESESDLLALVKRLQAGDDDLQSQTKINRAKLDFLPPDRSDLPALSRYAHLEMPDSTQKRVGYVEASRGCKHFCRHCPVVPVYEGKFRVIPLEIVMQDIREQVAAGATHISFGDPDFLNGPTHALRIVRAMHTEFPELTFDATIKIEHLLRDADKLEELRANGCLFITSAVESVDDRILDYLEKRHTNADFGHAARLLREAGIGFAPTFIPFTPWTSLEGYIALLERLVELNLVQAVPPVQLSIRLLVPEGSHLLHLPGFQERLEGFDPKMLGYRWQHPDPQVDHLQEVIQRGVAESERQNLPRREIFRWIWDTSHKALGRPTPALPATDLGEPIPHLSEPWFCCAEPTEEQLQTF